MCIYQYQADKPLASVLLSMLCWSRPEKKKTPWSWTSLMMLKGGEVKRLTLCTFLFGQGIRHGKSLLVTKYVSQRRLCGSRSRYTWWSLYIDTSPKKEVNTQWKTNKQPANRKSDNRPLFSWICFWKRNNTSCSYMPSHSNPKQTSVHMPLRPALGPVCVSRRRAMPPYPSNKTVS